MAEQKEKIIIGLTGTHGSGKGAVAKFLITKGFKHFSVSEFLAKEAERRGLTPDREARSSIADEFRKKGPTHLMECVVAQTEKHDGPVVIEAQYTKAEVEFIKERGGIEIAVDADMKVRYDRVVGRASEKDKISYEQFVATQQEQMASADPDDQNIAACVEAADYYLLNNGTKEELEREVEEILAKLGL